MDEKTDSETKKKRIDLSVAQVAGSAVAAAVAAFLAGQLGVYGTIIGAGVVSVVATTGGSIFQHLFRRTGEQIKEAATISTKPRPRRRSVKNGMRPPADATMVLSTFDKRGGEDEITSVAARDHGADAERTQLLGQAGRTPDDATRVLWGTDAAARPDDRTRPVPRMDDPTATPGQGPYHPAGATAMPHEVEEVSEATYGTKWRGWKRPALAALAIFALAMGVITGYEAIRDQTVAGEPGTSLSNIVTRGGGSEKKAPAPSNSPAPGGSGGHEGSQKDGGSKTDPNPSRSNGTGGRNDGGTEGGTSVPSTPPSHGGKQPPTPPATPKPDSSGGAGGGTGTGGGSDGSGSTGTDGAGQGGGGRGADNRYGTGEQTDSKGGDTAPRQQT